MNSAEAIDWIALLPLASGASHSWADLGCGNGLFTRALSRLLSPSGTVYAFDKNPQVFDEPGIQFFQMNFEAPGLPVPLLSGILMANSLHYIRDQAPLISRLKTRLEPGGSIAIIEYDTLAASKWVPYPVPSDKAKALASGAGFSNFKVLGKRRSVYQHGGMYLATFS